MRKKCVICDIDGVYTDSREWEKHAPKNPKDRTGWNNFMNYSHKCLPNPPIISIMKELSKVFTIIFLTSREDTPLLRIISKEQIENFSNGEISLNKGSEHKLFMRSFDDYRKAWEVKEEILKDKILPEYEPVWAIDDDPSNIEMYRTHNIPVYHYTDLK